MNLTKKQLEELETLLYFIPQGYKNIPILDKDIRMFFEWSERGLHKELLGKSDYIENGFQALITSKSWKGIHIEMYEEGIIDGYVPYYDILRENNDPVPLSVMKFLKKTMFQGEDAELIEKVYQSIKT